LLPFWRNGLDLWLAFFDRYIDDENRLFLMQMRYEDDVVGMRRVQVQRTIRGRLRCHVARSTFPKSHLLIGSNDGRIPTAAFARPVVPLLKSLAAVVSLDVFSSSNRTQSFSPLLIKSFNPEQCLPNQLHRHYSPPPQSE
jgi:hypothetical protein